MPVLQGTATAIITARSIAFHTPHQPQIGPSYIPVVRPLHLQQGLEIDLEFEGIVYILGHIGIEAVQAVDENHLIGVNLQGRMLPMLLSRLKVVIGDAHLFPCNQPLQVLVDQFQVQGLGGLVIIVTVLVFGMKL